jgi:hypothetical protein
MSRKIQVDFIRILLLGAYLNPALLQPEKNGKTPKLLMTGGACM